jgi:exopolysaccharide production protein ExoZ
MMGGVTRMRKMSGRPAETEFSKISMKSMVAAVETSTNPRMLSMPTTNRANNLPRPLGNSKVLQALRALAALLVALYHVNHSIFGLPKYWLDRPFGDTFEFGHAGVEFFFVLSGFIIFAAHRRDIGQQSRFLSFAWKRSRRIYPVYWLMLLIVVPVYFLLPSFGTGMERNLSVLVDSVTLLHLFGNGVVMTVSWTLFHEILFYAIFSLLILDRRLGTLALGAWMAASIVALFMGSALSPQLAFYFSPMHLLFGMGMGAAWLIGRSNIPAPWLVMAVGLALFFGAGAEEVAGGHLSADMLVVLYGLGSSLIMLAALELERGGRLRVPRVLVFLGNASYSIYLVHFIAMSVLAKVALSLIGTAAVPHSIIYLGLVAGSVLAGAAYHVAVEVPLLALLGQRSAPARIVVTRSVLRPS